MTIASDLLHRHFQTMVEDNTRSHRPSGAGFRREENGAPYYQRFAGPRPPTRIHFSLAQRLLTLARRPCTQCRVRF